MGRVREAPERTWRVCRRFARRDPCGSTGKTCEEGGKQASKKQDKSARKLQRPQSVTIAAAEKREQPRLRGPQANLIVMRPIDENRDDALIFTGIGSLFTAIAAVLLDYPMFATIFAFFSAFAVAVALRNEWEHRR